MLFDALELCEGELVKPNARVASGRPQRLDQLMRMVIRTRARAINRIQMLMLVLGRVNLAPVANRAEQQVGGDRPGVRVPDVGRNQLKRDAALGQHRGDRQHHSSASPAVGAVRLAGPLVEQHLESEIAMHVRHGW